MPSPIRTSGECDADFGAKCDTAFLARTTATSTTSSSDRFAPNAALAARRARRATLSSSSMSAMPSARKKSTSRTAVPSKLLLTSSSPSFSSFDAPTANSSWSRWRSYTQNPVSSNSGISPTPGPHTNTGESFMAPAAAGGSWVEPCFPPPRPEVTTSLGFRKIRTATHVTPRSLSKFCAAGRDPIADDPAAILSMAVPPTARTTASHRIDSSPPFSSISKAGGGLSSPDSAALSMAVTRAPPCMFTFPPSISWVAHGSKIFSAIPPRHHRTSNAPFVCNAKTWKQDNAAAADVSYPGAMGRT
mmetsp:Transcript_8087/g.24120  ORF Transcript_8087/g.24120 Transcript_8087/m.24120 type:complete len:303 (+) Transcript_8087:453-1361(+)